MILCIEKCGMSKTAMKTIVNVIIKEVQEFRANYRIEVILFGQKSNNIKYTANIEDFSKLLKDYA